MTPNPRLLPGLVLASALTTLSIALPAADEATATATAAQKLARVDFLDATYLPAFEAVVVTGHHGLVGMVRIDGDKAKLETVANTPNEDFTALAGYGANGVLLGSSSGRLYLFDGKAVSQVAELSEYEEPILDIATDGNAVWVVGARGLVARSGDGKDFEVLEIRDVTMPLTEFPAATTADWYFGVSNLDVDTIEFTAFKDGEPAIDEEHYIMYPDEGFVQLQTELDMDPPPTIAFKFSPGPPFRLGDVSWNVVLLDGPNVTLAGEFGMILQSTDGGETWIRRDAELVPREPEPAYWMAGVQEGKVMWLTGAAGVSQRSEDSGATWKDNPKPGREGIFGVTLTKDGTPLIAGAVGLIGTMSGNDWTIADRTRLKLLSWLKSPVTLPDGRVLVMGGRATAIQYDGNSFERVMVTR